MKFGIKYCTVVIGLLFFASACVMSQEREKTDYFFTGGLFAQGNIYRSDFTALPGYPNHSPGFETAFGFAPAVKIGMERRLKKELFGSKLRHILNLKFTAHSAEYSVDEFIGYDIENLSYEKLYTRHKLRANLPTVSIENALAVYPFEELPVSLNIGIDIGYFLSGTFEQSETILKEDRFFDNGTNQTNVFDADIPDAFPIYGAFTAAVRAKAFSFADFELLPELSASLAMTNITTAVDWQAHSVSLGVTASYNKPVPLPPVDEPLEPANPKLPLPEKPEPPKKLDMTLDVYYDRIPLRNGSEVIFDIVTEYLYDEFYLPSELYYKKGEYVSYVFAADSIIKESARIMADNPDKKMKVISYLPKQDAADNDIAHKRAALIKNTLTAAGIDAERIATRVEILDKDYKYAEMIEGDRRVELNFSGNTGKILRCRQVKDSDIIRTTKKLKIVPGVEAEAGLKSFVGTVIADSKGGAFADFDERGIELHIDKSFIKQYPDAGMIYTDVKVMATAVDNEDKEVLKEVRFAIMPNRISKYSKDTAMSVETYALGYFRFDGTRFSVINDIAIEKAKEAVSEGKKIKIIAGTDDLGSPEYNNELAERRMRRALKLLDLKPEDAQIIYNTDPDCKNGYERILSRAVYVEIPAE